MWDRTRLAGHRTKRWLHLGIPLWKWMAATVLILAIPQLLVHCVPYPANWSDAIRLSGVVLQSVGIVSVIMDLSGVARDLGAPPVWKGVALFGTAFMDIFRGPEIVSAAGVITGVSAVTAVGSFTVQVDSHGTLEDRVKNLEASLQQQQKDIGALRGTIDDHVESLKGLIDQEADQRRAGDATSAEHVTNAVLGAMHIKLSGVAYLIVGTICTSMPLNIAS
jgi:hypothetical protein